MRFTQEQLQSFFGENVDNTTLPAAITGNTETSMFLYIAFGMLIIIFLVGIIKWLFKSDEKDSNTSLISSSKELVTYSSSSAHDEDKKSNQNKNIYNKYYFNVYVKQPYNQNGKQSNYNNKSNHKYQSDKSADDIIDAEIVL